MRVQTEITAEVTVHYLDIGGLRFRPQAMRDREAEFHALRATSRLNRDGTLGRVYLSGIGKWVRKDGTVGLQDAKLTFSSALLTLPKPWKRRIEADLNHLASLVIIGEVRPVEQPKEEL